MVITNLEEKENRKIWVPIRPGNRGGWSLFDWEKVRDMPYRDREMYLGNSAKIGILDKGGKWRKKDWYLHKDKHDTGQALNQHMQQARRRDQQRMNAALGITDEDDREAKLTPAEMQALLKQVRGQKQDEMPEEKVGEGAIGLGFDKLKVQIRAKPSAKIDNPHRLEGNLAEYDQLNESKLKKQKGKDRSRSRSEKRKKKKQKKEKHQRRERQRSESEERHKKKQRQRSRSSQRKQKKSKKHKHRD